MLVDAGIVMTENVIRHAERYAEEHGDYRSKHRRSRRAAAARLVGRPIFFAMTIIIIALTGMEGKLFHPLAFTKTFAMLVDHHRGDAGAGAVHVLRSAESCTARRTTG